MVIFNIEPNNGAQRTATPLRCTMIQARHDPQETTVMYHGFDIQQTEIENAFTAARRERGLAFRSFFSGLFAWCGRRTDATANGFGRPTYG